MEYAFTLPHGYWDAQGQLQRHGIMRLASAVDEIEPANDPRAQQNALYLPILILARVITQLGTLPMVTPEIVMSLYAIDMSFLEEMYRQINSPDQVVYQAMCPHCRNGIQTMQAAVPI